MSANPQKEDRDPVVPTDTSGAALRIAVGWFFIPLLVLLAVSYLH